ncbi:MAG: hypothetical protein LUD27_02135 [Clostridia bacterium]|nr:hypothetical protein [Clostridia bacterium]
MAGYTKNIAVIRGEKSGFSTDGGVLSGLIKTEKYGNFLQIEVTLINFAPLSEGRYVFAVSDGAREEVFDKEGFKGESEVDTSYGFAAAVCFVLKGEVNLIATAICGDYRYAADFARRAVEKSEMVCEGENAAYDDEALAEENYYERDKNPIGDEGGGPVREDKEEEKEEVRGAENEDFVGVRQEQEDEGVACEKEREDEAKEIPLAGDVGFYERMKPEIERIFSTYPEEKELERVVENSRWAKISYKKGKFYVFGVIFMDEKPRYICYGAPSENPETPPESLKGMAGYIPVSNGGYWIMYQDAGTGVSIKIENG